MNKNEVKLENLKKMVADLEIKIKKLEAQKALYLLQVESLENKVQRAKLEEQKIEETIPEEG